MTPHPRHGSHAYLQPHGDNDDNGFRSPHRRPTHGSGQFAFGGPRRGLDGRLVALLVAVVAIVALFIGVASCSGAGAGAGCSAQPENEEPASAAPLTAEQIASNADAELLAAFESPYDWDGLVDEGGRLAYYEDGELASQLGIDVSEHQGWIDWNAVAADGIDFAYVRLGNRGYTEGVVAVDDYFEYNLGAASEAGLDVGVYFFSQAVSADEAREEAQFVIDQLDGRSLDLPIAYDHEQVSADGARANSVDRATMTECAKAFCDAISAAGYSPIIYGNLHDLSRYHLSQLTEYPLWLAEYDAAVPTAPVRFSMWQYTSSGAVAGIDGPVDLNLRFTGTL